MRIGKYRVYFKSSDWFIPLIIFIYTIAYYAETLRLPHPEVHNLLIRPVVYAIILLTGAYFFTRLGWEPAGEAGKEQKVTKAAGGSPSDPAGGQNSKFLPFLIGTVLYLPLISLLGFTVASVIYMVGAMLQLGVRDVRVLALLPLITVAGLVLMFETWLAISVPKGIFGF